jgi:hypothetical protein
MYSTYNRVRGGYEKSNYHFYAMHPLSYLRKEYIYQYETAALGFIR